MLYIIIRILIAAAAAGIAYVLFHNTKGRYTRINESRIRIYTVCIFAALTFVLYFLPIENQFLKFNSSEAAYQYNSFGTIIEINEYDTCAMVISTTGEENITITIIPNKNGKWRLATPYNQKTDIASAGYYVLERHYIPDSDDCIVIAAHGTAGNYLDSPTNVADSFGTKFNAVAYNDVPAFFYGYVVASDSNEEYSIMINGEKFSFN